MPRTRLAPLTALLLAALFLAGCGGGGGEPTVTQTLHDELQAELQSELDAALADLKTERDAKAKEAEARSAADAEVASLTEQIGSMDDAASDAEGASLNAQLNAAKAKVTELTAEIGSMDDAASDAEGASLNAQLNAAKAKVTELTAEIGTAGAAESLKGMLEAEKAKVIRLTAELEAANTSLTSFRGQLTTAQQEVQQAQQEVQQAQQEVQQAQQQTQGLEANQRAQNLLAVFPASSSAPSNDAPVTITVPAKNGLTFTQGVYTVRSLSATGFRGARLEHARAGAATVVYTDRELTRSLLDHYASLKNMPGDRRIKIEEVSPHGDDDDIVFTDNIFAKTALKVTNGPASQISASAKGKTGDSEATTERTRTVTRSAFNGSVHGVSGQFVCAGVANCMITLTGLYEDKDDTDPATPPTANKLKRLTISKTDSSTFYFDPSGTDGTPLSLCGDGDVCDFDDEEFLYFGYWRRDPEAAASAYTLDSIGVFAAYTDVTDGTQQVMAPATAFPDGVTGTATYDGTAVGLYVEEGPPTGTDVTHRQGEFTADVYLNANFVEGLNLNGTINRFNVTPKGGSGQPTTIGSWSVTLKNGGDLALGTRTAAEAMDGKWIHGFVGTHAGARAGSNPPSVVGTFNAKREGWLHLIGAFGAKLEQ